MSTIPIPFACGGFGTVAGPIWGRARTHIVPTFAPRGDAISPFSSKSHLLRVLIILSILNSADERSSMNPFSQVLGLKDLGRPGIYKTVDQ